MQFALDELDNISQVLLDASKGEKVWTFEGEMGAGKTTLIKAICKTLGISAHMNSPTFAIVNEYSDTVCHFDFYRLKKEEEAYDIGVEEYLDSGRFCFIEWPEKISSLLPEHRFEVRLEIESPTHRRIHYQKV